MIRYTPFSFCTEQCELGTNENVFSTPTYFEVEVPVVELDDVVGFYEFTTEVKLEN